MKKIKYFLISSILFLLVFYKNTTISLAGDIPESLLQKDYPVYFGEVESVDDKSITIIQRQPIKGEFTQDSEITYESFAFTESPIVGQVYLCGYLNEDNPLYIWEVDCYDTASLIITNTDTLSKRMQEYLNDGLFEEAEAMRINEKEAKETIELEAGQAAEESTKENAADTDSNPESSHYTASFVIGGADGPTSIFIAGKINKKDCAILGCISAALLAAFVFLVVKRRKSRKG